MHSKQEILGWRGRDVVDRDGDKVGSLEEIYLDAETDEPTWGAVKTGMFGSRSTFVPIRDADLDGEQVRVVHAKSQIKDAPNVDVDGELDPGEEDRLYDHYEIAQGTPAADDASPRDEPDAEARASDDDAGKPGPTSGTGGAVTGGIEDSAGGTPEGRRPRIRRVITEEVGEDGRVTKRETRTEETFS